MERRELRVLNDFVVHEVPADDDAEIKDAVRRTILSPGYRPPMLPAAAVELMSLSSRADADFDRIVHLLESDTLLAGRVLKLCNSPLHAAAAPVRSLKAAVVRMGLKELRDVVMEAAMGFRVFKTAGYSEGLDRVRAHSTATAHLSRAIARFTSFEDEYAFLCGLLHDVGLSAALVALGDAKGHKPLLTPTLWRELDSMHEDLGASVAAAWKLPAEVVMVIRAHHSLDIGGVVHPMAAIVTVADALAVEAGFGTDAHSSHQLVKARAALGFDDVQMQRVRDAAKKVLENLSA